MGATPVAHPHSGPVELLFLHLHSKGGDRVQGLLVICLRLFSRPGGEPDPPISSSHFPPPKDISGQTQGFSKRLILWDSSINFRLQARGAAPWLGVHGSIRRAFLSSQIQSKFLWESLSLEFSQVPIHHWPSTPFQSTKVESHLPSLPSGKPDRLRGDTTLGWKENRTKNNC